MNTRFKIPNLTDLFASCDPTQSLTAHTPELTPEDKPVGKLKPLQRQLFLFLASLEATDATLRKEVRAVPEEELTPLVNDLTSKIERLTEVRRNAHDLLGSLVSDDLLESKLSEIGDEGAIQIKGDGILVAIPEQKETRPSGILGLLVSMLGLSGGRK